MKDTQRHRISFRVALRSAASWLRTMRSLLCGSRGGILAAVSEKILSKVDRLFSNRLSDIFIELLQNARRAGATAVNVRLEETAQGIRIIFTDNGEGTLPFTSRSRQAKTSRRTVPIRSSRTSATASGPISFARSAERSLSFATLSMPRLPIGSTTSPTFSARRRLLSFA